MSTPASAPSSGSRDATTVDVRQRLSEQGTRTRQQPDPSLLRLPRHPTPGHEDGGIEVLESRRADTHVKSDAPTADRSQYQYSESTTSQSPISVSTSTGKTRISFRHRRTCFAAEAAHDAASHLWLVTQEHDKPAQVRIFDSVDDLHGLLRDWYPASPADDASPIAGTPSIEPNNGNGGASPADPISSPHELGTHEFPAPRIRPQVTSGALSFTWRQESSDDSGNDSDSNASTVSSEGITTTHWLDVQTRDLKTIGSIVNSFPVEKDTVERISEARGVDNMAIYATGNYVLLHVSCNTLGDKAKKSDVGECPAEDEGGDVAESGGGYRPEHYLPDPTATVCSILLFEDWIVTVHSRPFEGLAEFLHKLQASFGRHRRGRVRVHHTNPAPGSESFFRRADVGGHMTTAWVCANLVDFTTQGRLPDPSPALAEASACDEMALLTNIDDQMDMLQRIALLRRNINASQTLLYQKDRLIRQFLAPDLRTTFVARSARIAEIYTRAESQVSAIAERFTVARDVLAQASNNLASNVSLQMAQASNEMSSKMKVLSQVASICLPLNIITGTFGMNVRVPLQQDHVENLNAFAVICALMGLWLLLSLPPVFMRYRSKVDGAAVGQ